MIELTQTTAREVARRVNAGELKAVDVAHAALKRIEALDGRLNAFITIVGEQAIRDAEAVDRAVSRGRSLPLAGVPLAVKDGFWTKGVRTTNGSMAMIDFVPESDAEAVARLRRAGCVLVGKASMHEYAYGFTNENPHFGDAVNPWLAGRIPGGSTGGGAIALATGMALAAVGGDTGGSIRQPAALCGVVGLKVTYGRVSRHGGIPLSWSMDTVGPMARSVEDAALMLSVMAGPDPKDRATALSPELPEPLVPEGTNLAGVRVGVPGGHFFDLAEPEVAESVRDAIEVLRGLGAAVVPVDFPKVDLARAAHRAIIFAEAASAHEDAARDLDNGMSDDIRHLILSGLFLNGDQYLDGQRARRVVMAQYRDLWRSFDVLATPTSPLTATPIGLRELAVDGTPVPLVYVYLDQTMPFNLSGQPALSVPCGFSAAGLPIGLQLVGRPWEEPLLLRVGAAYQSATHWMERVPPGIGA
ncbi:amidase [Tautonia sociabilis]|uniref:Amidase n=1 Tax=Tautonia sociabilis TaxID=2080755 RepID=A0A432MNG2_9BACT|nr:amidase [Tautonia sociabilis]RUL88646.1 amidase [Tautonia sociabilis]